MLHEKYSKLTNEKERILDIIKTITDYQKSRKYLLMYSCYRYYRKMEIKMIEAMVDPDNHIHVVETAPDGKHSLISTKGTPEEMWDYFTMNADIRRSLINWPGSKTRLRNMDTGYIIGVLTFDTEKRKFLHLKG